MLVSKIPLVGLKADQFRHPLDLEATKALKQIPGLDMLIRNLLGPVAEQFFYVENIAASVLVGEQQLPQFHKLLLEAVSDLRFRATPTVRPSAPSPQCLHVCDAGQAALHCDAHFAD